MPKLIQSRYAQGLEAYRAGQGVGQLVATLDGIEHRYHELLDASGSRVTESDPAKHADIQAERDALHNGEFGHDAGPSLIAGFADGVIEDIRFVARQRRGQTA